MKSIPLTQGKIALVDDEDFQELNKHKWYFHQGYALRNIPNGFYKQKSLSMHRQIMKNPEGMEIDHKDMNKLNNQKKNLRLCSLEQNIRNRGIKKTNTSGYKGVSWNKSKGKWSSKIVFKRKQIHLGDFDDPENAAHAYDNAAVKYHGEFAKLNF